MINQEMDMADAVRIARSIAATETGDTRTALTMLCDLASAATKKEDAKKGEREMKKLTVGDNSGTQRYGNECTVVRTSLKDIEIGEEVLIRFKDEFNVTPWRRYRLKSKRFRDEWDEKRGRFTGSFERIDADKTA